MSIVEVSTGQASTLMYILRGGRVYLSSGCERLIVQAHDAVSAYRLQYFDLRDGPRAASQHTLHLETKIIDRVRRQLAKGAVVSSFWPDFVAWSDNSAIVSVGYYHTKNAPYGVLFARCEGMEVSLTTGAILRTFTATQLKRGYGADCIFQ